MEAEKDEEKKVQGACRLERWTKGLTEVADLKGKDATGRRETVIIEEIVKEINTRLELHVQRELPDLIGMDFDIHDISSWLKGRSSETFEILTISGMAGIGKTTLAKYIYGLHRHEFETSSFVEGIARFAQQTCSLLDLQKRLLGDIQKKRATEEHNAQWYTSIIEKTLSDKQTFLVLDDVDNSDQVDVLIGRIGLHPGSKVIVTTKDGSQTEKCALFQIAIPPKHTKHNVDVAALSDTIEMLETSEFDRHVHKVLQISFDSLPIENCKELFKHIACFFVGKDRETTEKILKTCGFRTSYGITKLVDRSLLTIGGNDTLEMHQLLQEMRKDLVNKESPEKPWKRSRLWKKPKVLGSLKILNLSYCKLVRLGGFSGLPALEMLVLVGCERLTKVCESVGGCDELLVLDMSYCNELRKLPSSLGKLKKLRVLSLNGCIGASILMNMLKQDDISIKPHTYFSWLTNHIPASPKSLLLSLPSSLIKLSLHNSNLRTESFPTDFSSLSELKELVLGGNPIDSLPDCVESLSSLQFLSLNLCSKLTVVSWRPPPTLRELSTLNCPSLVKVTSQVMPVPYIHEYLWSESLTESDGQIKIQALAQTNEKILFSLGWGNLEHVKYLELPIWHSCAWNSAKKLPIQMYFEYGIFSTCFPGEELPDWFRHRSDGSSLSFTIPSSPADKRIQGLNIGLVHVFPGRVGASVLGIKVLNMTKERS